LLGLTPQDVEDILTTTSEDKGSDGWDNNFGYGRINAYQALLAAQVWPTILTSDPANHAIDARQHTDRLLEKEFGIDFIDMDFPPEVVNTLTLADFKIFQKGGNLVPPTLADLQILDEDTVRIVLSDKIEPLAWTSVTHHNTGLVKIGFLPADVNANEVANEDDVLALVDHFLGVGDPLPIWSTDLDWSGVATPTDILTCINLLNGADLYETALGTSLP